MIRVTLSNISVEAAVMGEGIKPFPNYRKSARLYVKGKKGTRMHTMGMTWKNCHPKTLYQKLVVVPILGGKEKTVFHYLVSMYSSR